MAGRQHKTVGAQNLGPDPTASGEAFKACNGRAHPGDGTTSTVEFTACDTFTTAGDAQHARTGKPARPVLQGVAKNNRQQGAMIRRGDRPRGCTIRKGMHLRYRTHCYAQHNKAGKSSTCATPRWVTGAQGVSSRSLIHGWWHVQRHGSYGGLKDFLYGISFPGAVLPLSTANDPVVVEGAQVKLFSR